MRFILKSFNSSEFFEYEIDNLRYISNISEIESEDGEFFVFHPFEKELEKVAVGKVIGKKKANLNFKKKSALIQNQSTKSKKDYLKLVGSAINTIKKSELEKVVISRPLNLILAGVPEWSYYLSELASNYPIAAIYLFENNGVKWIGATPEQLILSTTGSFSIASLAGTIPKTEQKVRDWTPKEYEEQQIVTNEIERILSDLAIKFKTSPTYQIDTGNLLHLKSDLSGKISTRQTLSELINKLHPTPATCGLPKSLAKEFIISNEGYQREYYTGFFGFVNFSEISAELYVNLRCLKANENKVSIFAGGGITASSKPEKEWEETEAKSQTLKRLFN